MSIVGDLDDSSSKLMLAVEDITLEDNNNEWHLGCD